MPTETFNPDNLIAGDIALRTESITVISGQTLTRGAVLGAITASGKYNLSLSAAGDGSQVPTAILAEDVDASGGDVTNVPVFVRGDFNTNALTIGAGHTEATIKPILRDGGIFIKSAVENG